MGELIGSEGEFEYRVMNSDVAEEGNVLVSQEFAARGAIASYVGLSADGILQHVRDLFNKPDSEKLSLVAVHCPTREICGALINERYIAESPSQTEVPAIVSDIEAVIRLVTEGQHAEYNLGPDGIFHQLMLAVPERWKGNNIGLNLMKFSLVLAQQHGFSMR